MTVNFDATKVFVAGHNGLVGSAIVRSLRVQGYAHILMRMRSELDLLDQSAVDRFFAIERPDHVYMAAAKVGGILANSRQPAQFIHENLVVQTNIIHAAWRNGVRKLCFLGSSCIYPKNAPQPMREEYLLSGPLETTNEAYAVAKIAGIKMCQAYRTQYGFDAISLMPTNLYGPGDNFNPEGAHVVPALLHRFHEAAVRGDNDVTLWGSGTPRREFLHVDDLAAAATLLMDVYSSVQIINVGAGQDITIRELAGLVAEIVGFKGEVRLDASKPDGPPQKLLDIARLKAFGWIPTIGLRSGLQQTYRWYLDNLDSVRR